MRVIDFHTHAFPDWLADRAVATLEAEAPCRARLDGRVSSLLTSMDAAGVAVSVVASIATKPQQFASILDWSLRIASHRIVPFASVHPEDPEAVAHVRQIAEAGLRGVKLHPYYQGFTIDEERMAPIYAEIERNGLVLLLHAGYDIAFERRRIANPARIAAVVERFPRLALVAAHLGGWEDWDEVESRLAGAAVWLDLSYTLHRIAPGQARRILEHHPHDRLLFGSDSPWDDQSEALARVRETVTDPEALRALLCGNAERLLGRGQDREGRGQ